MDFEVKVVNDIKIVLGSYPVFDFSICPIKALGIKCEYITRVSCPKNTVVYFEIQKLVNSLAIEAYLDITE
jgi:hypothetical protein